MQTITSTKNQYVKLARSLSQKKFRVDTGLMLVEGVNLIKDMPSSVVVKYVFTTKERAGEVESIFAKRRVDNAVLSEKNCDLVDNVEIFEVDNNIIDYISNTVTPYGIVAVCEIPIIPFEKPKGNALLLDAITDPGNMGTIMRSAAACGFLDIYMLDCVDLYSPKVVRATLGGLFRVRAFVIDEQQAIELMKDCNSAVLDMDGENILTANVPKPLLFVAGNEAHGVRDSLKDIAKHVYSLPMQNGIESLNVAVATSVAMYQTV